MARKFLGAPYPIVDTPNGLLAQSSGVDQIKADLLQLLLTNPGERVMLPAYGTPLKRLFFEPNDPTIEGQARQMIATAIKTWEPRIIVSNIIVSRDIDEDILNSEDTLENKEHILFVQIDIIDPEDISEVQSLVLFVPLSGEI